MQLIIIIIIIIKTRERLSSAKFLGLGISDFWAYEAYCMTVAHFTELRGFKCWAMG